MKSEQSTPFHWISLAEKPADGAVPGTICAPVPERCAVHVMPLLLAPDVLPALEFR
ncbi:hypothetical protein BURPS1710b_A1731 [Burkholderia pseudomallei 1710b]|uniref:Uncharacterized protein n=1 Tax=Burkholderia pseudomallei (strain 1710b) TaxID=320372 RepID=Q3JHR4_BURP1|nr:hypothetical protein BURPS1710b_A1731 [Burkholderia pseudomallei 1710b]